MSAKWKIALLAMLGLSTAACCSTKKAKKSEDPKSADVDNVTEDPRVMLMYGVPFPEGEIARPVTDEDLERVKKEGSVLTYDRDSGEIKFETTSKNEYIWRQDQMRKHLKMEWL